MKNLRTMMVAVVVVLLIASMGFGSFTSSAQAVEVTIGEPVEMIAVPFELVQRFSNLGLSTMEVPDIKFIPIPVDDLRRHRKTILKYIDPAKGKHEMKIYLLLCHTT